MMKIFFASMILIFPNPAQAERLASVEVACWHSSVDEGGYYCQYVTLTGRKSADNSQIVASLAAPDMGGPKTQDQAFRACQALGFRYAREFILDQGEGRQVILSDAGPELEPAGQKILQHLICE